MPAVLAVGQTNLVSGRNGQPTAISDLLAE